MSDTQEATIRPWVKRGLMMVNTAALDHDDPDHVYNQIVEQGLAPEDFGVEHPLAQEFKDKSRGQLIAEIMELRKEITGFHRVSAMWR